MRPLDLLRMLAGYCLPMNDGPAEGGDPPPPEPPDPPDDGTVPVDGGTPPAEPDAPPADGDAPPAGDEPGAPAEDDEMRRLREQNARLTKELQERDQTVRDEAEQLLYSIVPEVDPSRSPQPPPRAEADDDDEDTELSADERLERLEYGRRQDALERESQRLLDHMQGLRGTAEQPGPMPNLDIPKALNLLAQAGDREVDVDRLCQLVNDNETRRLDREHNRRLSDPEYCKQLVERYNTTGSMVEGASPPAPPAGNPPANPGPKPPRIPKRRSGAAPTNAEPITRKNVSKVFAERLAASGFGQR